MIGGAAIAVACVIILALFMQKSAASRKVTELLDLGNKYLTELNYDEAIVAFENAIAIDPKCAQAYLGKAQAQYALGKYDDAAATLREGIARCDDSAELEAYLQKMLDEIAAKSRQPLLLNYTMIQRGIPLQEAQAQLEVLRAGEGERYTWSSSNPECVSVSDTGLVTCYPVSGEAVIRVTAADGRSDQCTVRIGEDLYDLECVRVEVEEGSMGDAWYLSAWAYDGGVTIDMNVDEMGRYVYYSGDVVIPEYLEYGGKSVSVTGLSYLFIDCVDLESIFIPAGVTNVPIVFDRMDKLREIRVDADNPAFQSVDGVLYSKDGKVLYRYPSAKQGDSYTVPKDVEEIWPNALLHAWNLKEILVEDGNEKYSSKDGVLVVRYTWGGESIVAYPCGREAVVYEVPAETSFDSSAFEGSGLKEVIARSAKYISIDGGANLRRIEGGSETTSIYIRAQNMVEIAGIDNMSRLEALNIGINDREEGVKAADLRELGRLTGLKSLSITGVRSLDGWGWLNPLQNLETVEIGETEEITDDLISFLQSLPGLKKLSLCGLAQAGDLSWIGGLTSLTSLELGGDSIAGQDMSFLQNLPDLNQLSVYGLKQMKDLSWISKLTTLGSLELEGEFTAGDVSFLSEMPGLTWVVILNDTGNDGLRQQFEKLSEADSEGAYYYYYNEIQEENGEK